MVEALFDGRLGTREKASIERHVAMCAVCSAHREALDAIRAHVRGPDARADMRDVDVAPLAHQRARGALLRSAVNLESTTAATSTNGWLRARFAPFAIAAAVVAVALFVGFSWGRSTGPVASSIASANVAAPILTQAAVDPESGARFERARNGDADEVKLSAGTLRVRSASKTATKSGERLVVRVGSAVLKPKESVFRVTAVDGELQSVVVEEGSVELEVAGYYAEIPAGGSWRSPALTAAITPPAPSSPSPSPSSSSSSSPSSASSPSSSSSSLPPVAVVAPPSPKSTQTSSTPKPKNGFSSAMRSIDSGDYDAAANEMGEFSKTHPNDPRADEADYMRAIALERAGRADDAKAAARAYLAKWPSGAHRAEATAIANR